jgi:hypothetical protein
MGRRGVASDFLPQKCAHPSFAILDVGQATLPATGRRGLPEAGKWPTVHSIHK